MDVLAELEFTPDLRCQLPDLQGKACNRLTHQLIVSSGCPTCGAHKGVFAACAECTDAAGDRGVQCAHRHRYRREVAWTLVDLDPR